MHDNSVLLTALCRLLSGLHIALDRLCWAQKGLSIMDQFRRSQMVFLDG